MINSKIFYQILYQNDTLFRVKEAVAANQTSALPPIQKEQVLKDFIEPVPALEVSESRPIVKQIPVVQPFPTPEHQVLILTDNPLTDTLMGSERELLSKILKAVQQDLDHTDVYNFSFLPGYDANHVLSNKRTNYFITFGIPLLKLKLDVLLVPYMPKQVDGIWFLHADPLAHIEKDIEAKKKLWNALKQMFQK